jgi:HKD family nuclease
MEILYSDILPLSIQDGQKSILDAFREQLIASDSFEFAVGYVSKASLEEIDNLVSEYGITHVSLVIGMYYIEGMPESTYRTALAINEKWKASGIGEIRLVKAFKYHGKLYAFLKGGVVFSAIIGSANLGVIKPEANNRRQYEVSALIRGTDETEEILSHIRELQSDRCSINIADVHDMTLIREINVSLTGVDTVERVPQTEVALYDRHKTGVSFVLPIKVPAYDERHMDDGKHFTKSNLNVSYAAPRSARKSRDWYETQFTVSKSITLLPGYPEKNKAFSVVTDDGYTFKAHTTSDGNKQFSAVGDELILGRWIKGRLAAAGLVTPVNDTQLDHDRTGMITKEMLEAYGCNTLVLTKTDQKTEDENGELLDVWFLSFEAVQEQEDEE